MSPSAPAPSICDIRGPLMIGPSGLHATLTGPVEALYIERNAIGVANAPAAADMALAGIRSVVPPDEVILALRNVQTLLPMELRDTTLGGLGITPTAQQLTERWMARCRAAVPPQV